MTIARGKVLFPDIPSFEFYICALRVLIAILFMNKGKSPKRLRELSLPSQSTLPFGF